LKIVKLSTAETTTVTAVVPSRKKQDKLSYEIQHGSRGNTLWMWTANLSYQHFNPKGIADTLELTGDNYFLKTLYKDGNPTSDKQGNINYLITTDNMHNHKKDILLLWEIPNINNDKELEYTTSGMVSELGLGFTGRERGSAIGRTAAPVLEIVGDCTLTWTTRSDTHIISQTIKYDYVKSNWDIEPIKKVEIQKGDTDV
jgi:hypothetical protein